MADDADLKAKLEFFRERDVAQEADAMHGLLLKRIELLMGCTEGSPEEAELAALAEVVEAYENKRWPIEPVAEVTVINPPGINRDVSGLAGQIACKAVIMTDEHLVDEVFGEAGHARLRNAILDLINRVREDERDACARIASGWLGSEALIRAMKRNPSAADATTGIVRSEATFISAKIRARGS